MQLIPMYDENKPMTIKERIAGLRLTARKTRNPSVKKLAKAEITQLEKKIKALS